MNTDMTQPLDTSVEFADDLHDEQLDRLMQTNIGYSTMPVVTISGNDSLK